MYLPKQNTLIKGYCIAVVLLLLAFTVALGQPLAGKYTINQNSPASPTNFVSFQAFFNAATVKGVNNHVDVDVVSGSGPYVEQVTAPQISGVGSNAVITINGNSEILRYSATFNNQRHTLKFNGADYVTIKNLTIEATGSNYAWAVHYTNNSNNNVLDNCTIKVTNYTGIWDGIGIVVAASNSNALSSSGAAANNLTITSCTITGNALAGPGNGIVLNPQVNGNTTANITVIHSRIENFLSSGIFVTNGRHINIKNNLILRPDRESADDTYGIRLVNSSQEDTIIGNRIYNCYQSVKHGLYKDFYGIYINNTLGKIEVANNLIFNNNHSGKWYGVYLGCSENTKIVHNTLSADGATVALDEIYGFYHHDTTCNKSAGSEFRNNIISVSRKGSKNRYGIYQNSGPMKIEYNNLYLTEAGANVAWGGKDYRTLTDWQAATIAGAPYGTNSTTEAPNYSNIASGNLTPQAIAIDNTGANIGLAKDVANNPRNTANPDVGAYEFNVNANVKSIEMGNNNACEGETDSISVWIVNKSLASISNFKIGYTVNTQPEVFERINDTILSNDSLLYTFKTPLVFNTTGNFSIVSRIKGKPQIGPENITVTAEPKGSKIIQGLNYKGFFNGGDAIDPDKIAIGDSTVYEITPPVGFSNNNYGFTWQVERVAIEVLNSSKNIGGTDTVIKGAVGLSNTTFTFIPSSNLSGETLKAEFFVKNNNTGCLSKIERYIKIVGKPTAAFQGGNVCEGTILNFANQSTGMAGLQYKWYFGNGDSSQLTQPQKIYNTPGQYKVELFVFNTEGFSDSASTIVTIYAAPDADFNFANQCEGIAIDFADASTVTNGSLAYSWDLGDANGTANIPVHSYLYASNGLYTVTLTVTDSLGCTDKVSKQVTFAKKPDANFSFPTLNCNQKKVSFTNNTLNPSGIGFTWYFGDGDSAIIQHADHTYKQEGNYTVMLLARNGFNCVDTVIKSIALLGTPKPDFLPSTTCANERVIFLNTTQEPLNTEVSYVWTLNGGTTSADISPVFTFTATGDVEVNLKALAKNGCNAEIKRVITFTEKPIADFVIPQNVCTSIPYTATNNTVLSTGSANYLWQLGNKTSQQTSPTDTFNVKGEYKIQLIASTSVGCADTVSKMLNVIAIPNSDFIAESRRTGDGTMVITPVVENGEGVYKWIYSFGGGSDTKERHELKFLTAGTFNITLRIINQGCASTTSKNISVNPTSVKTIKASDLVKVYPNPTVGNFVVSVSENETIKKIEVFDIAGKRVYGEQFKKNNTQNINLRVKTGVYKLAVTTENGVYTSKIEILY